MGYIELDDQKVARRIEPVPTKPTLSARERWLLSDVSSLGRLTIATEQYDELRALATRLTQELKVAPEKVDV